MSADILQALLLFAFVLAGLFGLFMLLVNLQYQSHRRKRIKLRNIAHALGLEYRDHGGDLEEARPGFLGKLRGREINWVIEGRFLENEILIVPGADDPSVSYSLQGLSGFRSQTERPRAPSSDEEVEFILVELLKDREESQPKN